MFHGIRGRFIKTYALLVLLAVLLTIGGFLALVRYYYLAGVRDILESQAHLAARFYNEYFPADLSLNGQELAETFAQDTPARVQILTREGVLTGDSHDANLSEPVGMTPEVRQALHGYSGHSTGRVETTREPYIAVAVPLKKGDAIQGTVRLTSSLYGVNQVTAAVALILALLGLGAVGVTVITVTFLANSVVRPLTEVTRGAERMAAGDLTTQVPVYHQDEVGRLALTLNQMARELSQAEQLKNEFIASVSHELRTPLTAIKGYAVTLRESLPAGTEAGELREGLLIIDRETERLTGLVEELLDFSHLESGQFTLRLVPLRIDALIRDTVAQMQPRATRSGITLVAGTSLTEPVPADPNRMKQVLVNLIDNALKFTAPGGRVEVKTEPEDNGVRIIVSDTGCGIPPDELSLVKNRFFRGRAASGGSGLGLALADEIIALHGGTLEITSDGSTGTQAIIRMKAKPAPLTLH